MNIWIPIDLVVRKKMQENTWPGDCFPGETEADVARITEPINSQSSCVVNMQLPRAGVCVFIKGMRTVCFNKTC